jgi:hypothetical protein
LQELQIDRFLKGGEMNSKAQFPGELEKAIEGLLFMSESDYPFQVIEWDQEVEITADYLRGQVDGATPQTPVGKQSIDDFFRLATSEPSWKREGNWRPPGGISHWFAC